MKILWYINSFQVYVRICLNAIMNFLKKLLRFIEFAPYVKIISADDSIVGQMARGFPSFKTGYKHTVYCINGFLNTLMFALMQRGVDCTYTREVLNTNDGGQFTLDWSNLNAKNDYILLIVPGINTTSRSSYITHAVEQGIKADCKTVVINHRGIDTDLLTPKTYCAIDTTDLEFTIKYIKNKYPTKKIFALGFSLGGIQLGRFISKANSEAYISNAMIVSVPFNMFSTIKELNKPIHFFITKNVVQEFMEYGKRHKPILESDGRFNYGRFSRSKSLHDVVESFIFKQSGFQSCDDYYREACLDRRLQYIKVPTLFLNAADDMFSPYDAIPLDEFESNSNIALMLTKCGGHISFPEGWYPKGCNYACRVLYDYLDKILLEYKLKKDNKCDSASSPLPQIFDLF